MSDQSRFICAFLINHPHDAARVLERLAVAQAAAFVAEYDPQIVAPALVATSDRTAADILGNLSPAQAASVLAEMPANEIAFILRAAENDAGASWLQHLPKRLAGRVRRYQRYSVDQVGAWTRPEPLELRSDSTAADAQSRIETSRFPIEDPVFLIESGRKFAGAVRLADMMRATGRRKLRGMAIRDLKPIYDRTRIESVPDLSVWSRQSRAPVVDRTGRLVGTLDWGTVHEALQEGGIQERMDAGSAGPSTLLDVGSLYFESMSETLQMVIAPGAAKRKR